MIDTSYILGDCVNIPLNDDSVDLVITSPPYEDARTYGIQFKLKGDEYIDWCVDRFMEHLRICRGLVAWVIEGRTNNYSYSATPFKLMVRLMDMGVFMRKPAVYERDGIPGSGGPDWLKNRWEPIICATKKRGPLPWSDPTACGEPPKYPPGGRPSHHSRDGRVNKPRLSEYRPDGTRKIREYKPPALANPGNVIKCPSGGGHMGNKLAGKNEASFPERLVEVFVKSFCPPGGIVADPFCGSGTVGAVAKKHGRGSVLMDIREDQLELSKRRMGYVKEQQ